MFEGGLVRELTGYRTNPSNVSWRKTVPGPRTTNKNEKKKKKKIRAEIKTSAIMFCSYRLREDGEDGARRVVGPDSQALDGRDPEAGYLQMPVVVHLYLQAPPPTHTHATHPHTHASTPPRHGTRSQPNTARISCWTNGVARRPCGADCATCTCSPRRLQKGRFSKTLSRTNHGFGCKRRLSRIRMWRRVGEQRGSGASAGARCSRTLPLGPTKRTIHARGSFLQSAIVTSLPIERSSVQTRLE